MDTASSPQFPEKEAIEHERGTAAQADVDQPLFEAVQAEHIYHSTSEFLSTGKTFSPHLGT